MKWMVKTQALRLNGMLLVSVFIVSLVNAREIKGDKVPVIVITDLYQPYQDPGDNFDLITPYALPEINLKAVILDITGAFRKPVADAPYLWHDPHGPREAGIVPVMQLNYIFNRSVPFAVGPLQAMQSPKDQMLALPGFQQEGINLLLKTLRESKESVNIVSFGSARIIAVAYNRDPSIFEKKVKKIYLNAGTAEKKFGPGKDAGANSLPGGEWNVALDKFAFIRLLKSDLPIAIFPPANKDGAFTLGHHNTYWQLSNLQFIRKMNIKLQRYLCYSFEKLLQSDFLRAMDQNAVADSAAIAKHFPHPHQVWETAVWIEVSGRKLVKHPGGSYGIIPAKDVVPDDRILSGNMIPCSLSIRGDGRFIYEKTKKKTNFRLYERKDPLQNQLALQQALPDLYISFRINR